MHDASATDLEKSSLPVWRIVLELVLITALLGGWLGGTGASLVGDTTPIPGDGTIFGEIAGVLAGALVLRLNVLRCMLWERLRRS